MRDFGAIVYLADIDKDKAADLIDETGIRYLALDMTSAESITAAIKTMISCRRTDSTSWSTALIRERADWGLKFEKIPFAFVEGKYRQPVGRLFPLLPGCGRANEAQGGGSIINLGSTYGVVAPDFSIYEGTEMTMPAAYAAIKGGGIALTNYLATYYAKYKVRANTVSPGGIFDNQPSPFVEKYRRRPPWDGWACPMRSWAPSSFSRPTRRPTLLGRT